VPDALVRALSQSDLRAHLGRGLPLVTVDAAGRPHPMLVSYLELRAVGPDAIRLVIPSGSSSARNLVERGAATLLIVEPDRTVYLKCRAAGQPLAAGALSRFDLRVEDALEDRAADWEAGARITSGIGYAPIQSLDTPEAAEILALLER
jgi:hypothetical protein